MRLKFKENSNWALGVVLYFIIIYVPGVFFWYIFPSVFEGYYAQGFLPAFLTLPSIFLCIVVVCFFSILKLFTLKVKKISISLFLFCLILLSFSFLFMLLSLKLSGQVTHSFRHQGRLSDYGSLGYIYYFSKTFCEVLFLRLIFTKTRPKLSIKARFILFLSAFFFSLGSVFLSIGSFQFISVVFALVVMFISMNVDINYYLSKINGFSLMALGLTAVGTIAYGVGVKVGFDAYLDPAGRDIIINYLGKLVARLSTSLYSAHYALGDYLSSPVEFINTALKIASQRFETLFLGRGSDELLSNINSYNYKNVFASQGSERGGASPGPIGTIFYLLPSPFGFFSVIGLLLVARKSLIDKMPVHRSWIHIFIIIYMLTRLLESPVLYLQILDLSFIFFVIFITVFLFVKVRKIAL